MNPNGLVKLWHILDRTQRRKVITLFILMVLAMVLEALSIGIIAPVIKIISDDNVLLNYPYFHIYIYKFIIFDSINVTIISAVLIIFTLKALFLAYNIYYQMVLIFGLQESISSKLFNNYIYRPLSFHLNRKSSQLINNVINETNLLTHTAIISFFTIVAEILIFIGITLILIIIEPLGTFLLAVLLIFFLYLFTRFTSHKFRYLGDQRLKYETIRLKNVQESLYSIKVINLLHCYDYFIRNFNESNAIVSEVGRLQKTIGAMPRILLELLAIFSFCLLFFYITFLGFSAEYLIYTVTIFAAAAFRLIPSINRLVSGFQGWKFSVPAIENLYLELISDVKDNNDDKNLHNPNFIFKELAVNNLSFSYENSFLPIFSKVCFSILNGQKVGIIGPSGSGKSTLVDLIMGFQPPAAGSILINGIELSNVSTSWQKCIGYVPQSINLLDGSLRQNIAFGVGDSEINDDLLMNAINSTQLTSFVDSLKDGVYTNVGEFGGKLSGGQRQRIGIARALYFNPQVIILDEATSALDYEMEREVMKVIDSISQNKTLIVVAHRLSTVSNCDFLIKISTNSIEIIEGNSIKGL